MSNLGLEVENVSTIITTVICSIGIVLNTLNIVITVAHPFKGSLYVYLIALSVVDGLYCLVVVPTRIFRCGHECVHDSLGVGNNPYNLADYTVVYTRYQFT